MAHLLLDSEVNRHELDRRKSQEVDIEPSAIVSTSSESDRKEVSSAGSGSCRSST